MIQIEVDLAKKIEPAEAIKETLKKDWNIELGPEHPLFWAKIIIDDKRAREQNKRTDCQSLPDTGGH